MQAALRVLKPFITKQLPEEADVWALERIAGPCPPNIGLDEFARSVILSAVALEHGQEPRKVLGAAAGAG